MKSNFYTKAAYSLAGRFSNVVEGLFRDQKKELLKADIRLSIQEYSSTAIFSSILMFLVSVPLISIITGLISGSAGILSGLIAGLFLGIFLAVWTFMFFYVYPNIQITNRQRKIDHALPFATMYLSTLAGTGSHPAVSFEMLGKFREYGEVSREARKISREVYSFGVDIKSALEKAADRTPSDRLRDLLWGINNILSSGGDFRAFLQEKSEYLMAEYMRDLDKFTNNLSLFIEIYITLVIVGSVFVMVLSAIMGPIGLNPAIVLSIQVLEVFLFLPLAALAFMVFLKSISPVE